MECESVKNHCSEENEKSNNNIKHKTVAVLCKKESSHLKIRMDSSGGLTSYPQKRAEGICSTPEVKKLADVLEAVALFDFKGEILKDKSQSSEFYSWE